MAAIRQLIKICHLSAVLYFISQYILNHLNIKILFPASPNKEKKAEKNIQ